VLLKLKLLTWLKPSPKQMLLPERELLLKPKLLLKLCLIKKLCALQPKKSWTVIPSSSSPKLFA
jgi:hypothetical protein